MINIQFSYEVIAVDNTNKTMTIRYSATNYPDIEEIVPFPILPDTVEIIAHNSAPFYKWRALSNQFDIPVVGSKGAGAEISSVQVNFKTL